MAARVVLPSMNTCLLASWTKRKPLLADCFRRCGDFFENEQAQEKWFEFNLHAESKLDSFCKLESAWQCWFIVLKDTRKRQLQTHGNKHLKIQKIWTKVIRQQPWWTRLVYVGERYGKKCAFFLLQALRGKSVPLLPRKALLYGKCGLDHRGVGAFRKFFPNQQRTKKGVVCTISSEKRKKL